MQFSLKIKRCDKDTALRFTQRRICKWDTTIKQDGPSTCRILRPKENKEVTLLTLSIQKRIHGWQNIGLEMYYENKDTVADIHQLQLDQDNDLIQREIEKNEMRLKNDFKNKIAHLQQFYRELNQKYSFSSSDPNFKEKITNAKLDLISKRNQPIKYLKTKGMKYIELFNEISQNKKLADHGLFNRLQVFNQLRTDDCKVKEKLLGELYKQKKESQSLHHKELQHNIQIYDNIEEQSGQMLKIIDQNNDFSMSLRKNQQKLIVSQRTIAFAEDFNRTKYLFNYSSKNQMQKMFEIPEIAQIPQSTESIKLRKHFSSPQSLDDHFDNCLNQFAHEVLEYQQEMLDKDITTCNIEKMLQKRENLRCSQIRKVSKTSHSHQPSIHLEFSKVKCQHQSTRDKESTKAGNSFNIKQRSYLVSPFSKS
ncbi:unnamed protein product (macronuclear) [Paramecium tetraurelia]|uniref:Uncharacterized protein n=1 Tax=Paramecium tetraurelia TaxID=5888 RepID=A0DX01_PARTE|nr:uncharacterized protein GSPATT00021200001 [Paramecium tetraurelia]CAK87568.1 unnamed protein product [Paramecium tetraurelia]|eukprot:XP_001454965.1 hypothetical protein (macronuclear) [Paramecium tetraurelia strain d4-2]